MKPLSESFYNKETSLLAKELLGKILIHNSPLGITSGIIVETEAYLGLKDPAAHSYRKMTERNKAMFGKPGLAYIYFTYGMHYCFNVTAGPIGIGEGVLLRALEPVNGVEIMKERRNIKNSSNIENELINLTNGPAKLVQAMGITKDMYGVSLINSNLRICDSLDKNSFEIVTTTRIGIKEGKELPLRFYIRNNKFVSKK